LNFFSNTQKQLVIYSDFSKYFLEVAAINKIKERPNTGLTTRRELAIREQSPLHHKPLVIIQKPNAKRKKGEEKKETDKKCLEHDTTVAGATIT
jgi:hypothetical protein